MISIFRFTKRQDGHLLFRITNSLCTFSTIFSNRTEHREADTFFCFTILMSEIRDLYNSQLDHDRSSGIVSMMTKLNNLLLKMDK